MGITLDQWFRHYHKPYYIDPPTPEEVAWRVINVYGWPASPELHAYLTQFIKQVVNYGST